MKLLLVALGILISLPLCAAPLPEGKVVRMATYTGVIFTPQLLKDSFFPLVLLEHHKPTYWAPSPELIAKAEQTFRQELTKAYASIPPEGFHYRDWYTPKHYSRDRGRAQPIDFFSQDFYGQYPKKVAAEYRQYIGVTIAGKRALYVHFVGRASDNDDSGWKTNWLPCLGGNSEFFYVVQTGELSEWPF